MNNFESINESAGNWMLRLHGHYYGPCTSQSLASMIQNNELPFDTQICSQGSYWFSISDSRELQQFFPELFHLEEGESTKTILLTNTHLVRRWRENIPTYYSFLAGVLLGACVLAWKIFSVLPQ